jgi:hypothetical protein
MQIRHPITLRIKRAEILQSQLGADDLSGLQTRDPPAKLPAVCPAVYCEGGYSFLTVPPAGTRRRPK